MAQDTEIKVNQYTWTQLSDADITAATWFIAGPNAVRFQGTVGAVAPTDPLDGITYKLGEGEISTRTLADIWPGLAADRLYAKSIGGDSKVKISHA